MSKNSTIFISGFSLGVNEDDGIVVLRLSDSVQEDYENIHNFALPYAVSKRLYEGLKDIMENNLDSGTESNNLTEEK